VQREEMLGENATFSQEPTAEAAVALADELEAILRPLDPLMRRVLELRLQGQSLEEIAGTHPAIRANGSAVFGRTS